MEACPHGNPMSAACKLCGRTGPATADPVENAATGEALLEAREMLAIAFGLLVAVDPKKAGDDWAASFEEWKARYAVIDPRGEA